MTPDRIEVAFNGQWGLDTPKSYRNTEEEDENAYPPSTPPSSSMIDQNDTKQSINRSVGTQKRESGGSFGIVRSLRSLFQRVDSHDDNSSVEVGNEYFSSDDESAINYHSNVETKAEEDADDLVRLYSKRVSSAGAVGRTKSMLSISSISQGSSRTMSRESIDSICLAPEMPNRRDKNVSAQSSITISDYDEERQHNENTAPSAITCIEENIYQDMIGCIHEVDANMQTASTSIESLIHVFENAVPVPLTHETQNSNIGRNKYSALEMSMHFYPIYGAFRSSIRNSMRLLLRVSKSLFHFMDEIENEIPPHDYLYLRELAMQADDAKMTVAHEDRDQTSPDVRGIILDLHETKEQLYAAHTRINTLTQENRSRQAIIDGYRSHAEDNSRKQIVPTMLQGNVLDTSKTFAEPKQPAWLTLPRNNPKQMSIADMMESVIQLWDSLNIPLLHRSLFYGSRSSSIKDGLMFQCDNNLEKEIRRLQWVYGQMKATSTHPSDPSISRATKSKLLAGLNRERFWLVKQLSNMKRGERQTLYQNWGVQRYSDSGSKRVRRKQRLVEMIWNVRGRERQSAELVLHLYCEVANTMPLLDPRMCMIESFYAISP